MNGQVFWLLTSKVKAGQFEAVNVLMNEMVEATYKTEPGAMNYEWFICEDKTECRLYERYTDEKAALVHLSNFSRLYAERFMALLDIKGMDVYGQLDGELRRALSRLSNTLLTPIGGFSR